MNILFIHEKEWLKKGVFELHDLSELLSLSGHKVFAIDYDETWKRKHLFDIGTLKTKEFKNVNRAHAGASVILRRPGIIKLPGLSRLSAFFTHYKEIKKTIKEENIDAIVMYSVPTNGLQTIWIAKNYNIPVIFRSIDIIHQIVKYRFLRPLTYFLEKKIYKEVDKILALTPKLQDYVVQMGADRKKVALLPPGIDTNRFKPDIDCSALRKELAITKIDKIIVFIGRLFEFSGLDQYIRYFPTILKEIPETKLIVVGSGEILEKLKKLVNEMNLSDKVILTGFQPYDTVPQYINLADVCINPFLLNNATKDVIPTKILQYLACSKPVVATRLPGMVSILPDESCGVIYSKDVRELIRDTMALLRSEEKLHRLGQNGCVYVKNNHDWMQIAHILEKIIIEEVKGTKVI